LTEATRLPQGITVANFVGNVSQLIAFTAPVKA